MEKTFHKKLSAFLNNSDINLSNLPKFRRNSSRNNSKKIKLQRASLSDSSALLSTSAPNNSLKTSNSNSNVVNSENSTLETNSLVNVGTDITTNCETNIDEEAYGDKPLDMGSSDDFLDHIIKLQGSRIDDQRIVMPSLSVQDQKATTDTTSLMLADKDDLISQIIERGAPYPMVVLPAKGEYWLEGDYRSEDKNVLPALPYIDMSKCVLTDNTTVYNYRKSFVGKEHLNFTGVDTKYGEVLISILFRKSTKEGEVDQYKVILRLCDKSICEIVKASVFHTENPGPRNFMRLLLDDNVYVKQFYNIASLRAGEKILDFDEHSISTSSKIGVIYQKFGQTSENEFLHNQNDSIAFSEFLDTLGTCIQLKDFTKFRGGLDIRHGLTGEKSYFTEYKSRQIMFHVSTLLPYSPNDTQNIERKRHIGNDIVALIFQDQNTPFNPRSITTQFIHIYIIVQVEKMESDETYYKVSVAAKEGVPKFPPFLPNPSIFKKGPEFREFLLAKMLNAETAAYKSESFAKLVKRTRVSRFKRLVNEFITENDKLLIEEPIIHHTRKISKVGLLSSVCSALRSSRSDTFVCGTADYSTGKTSSLSMNDISLANSNSFNRKSMPRPRVSLPATTNERLAPKHIERTSSRPVKMEKFHERMSKNSDLAMFNNR